MRITSIFVLLVVCLAVGMPAQAKRVTKTYVVGADGASVAIRGEVFVMRDFAPAAESAPMGPFYLVYPVMEADVPIQPGRYFPAARVACFSWDRVRLGTCVRVSDDGVAQLNVARSLRVFTHEPTTLSRVVIGKRRQHSLGNHTIAIELAFDRSRSARPAKRPHLCVPVRAGWRGPQAGRRPQRFCVGEAGIWHAGRLYPASRELYRRFEEIHWPFGPPYPG